MADRLLGMLDAAHLAHSQAEPGLAGTKR
jgi:hypothetical protein